MKLFVVIEEDRVVFQADTVMEGLAFIAGRRGGVLCGVLSEVLSKPRETSHRPSRRERTIPRRKIA